MEPTTHPSPSRERTERFDGRAWLMLVLFVGVTLAVGGLGGWVTADAVDTWYPSLEQPSWTPPNWVFGPVWTLLYVLMGTAGWLVWEALGWRDGSREMTFYGTQLALNFAWSGLFFGLHRPGLALAEIVVLWFAIAGTLVLFWRVRPVAGWLFVPYLAWVTFASFLNGAIWWLNR